MQAFEPLHKSLSQEDIVFARTAAKSARRQGGSGNGFLNLQINGSPVPQGSYLSQIVSECLEFIADEHSVTVMPSEEEIGTQEAADMLKVSRPYLVKLLDAKALPSRKVGVQRRVKIEDVLAYQAREKRLE